MSCWICNGDKAPPWARCEKHGGPRPYGETRILDTDDLVAAIEDGAYLMVRCYRTDGSFCYKEANSKANDVLLAMAKSFKAMQDSKKIGWNEEVGNVKRC